MNTIKLSDLNIYDIGNTINIAGVIYANEEQTYLAPLPSMGELSGEMVQLVMDVDDWNTFLRQTDIQEIQVDTPHGKAILRKSNRMIDAAVSWRVFKRDDYCCIYCGTDDAPLTVDHLILWQDGGPSTEENLVTSCRKCNKARGDKTYVGWLKSPYYKRVSQNLNEYMRIRNSALADSLGSISRVKNIRSR